MSMALGAEYGASKIPLYLGLMECRVMLHLIPGLRSIALTKDICSIKRWRDV
jgi:hypothetical protein